LSNGLSLLVVKLRLRRSPRKKKDPPPPPLPRRSTTSTTIHRKKKSNDAPNFRNFIIPPPTTRKSLTSDAPAGAGQRSIMSFCAPVLTEEDLQEKIKGYACEWLLEDMLPTSIAESKPFRKFLQRVISTTGGNKVIQPMNKLSRQPTRM
jgi:hypothetical protein